MTFNEYQQATRKTAIYPHNMKVVYPTIGLAGETGEVAEKVKKTIRDKQGVFDPDTTRELAKELGDVLWYIANIASDLGLDLNDVAQMNVDKIHSRQARNLLHGQGDNR